MGEAPAPLPRRLLAEGLGTALLVAAVVGSGIMAERLAGGNAAIALLGNTIPTGAILIVIITIFGPRLRRAFQSGGVAGVCGCAATCAGARWCSISPCRCAGGIAGTVVAHLMFDLAPLSAIGIKGREGPSQLVRRSGRHLRLLVVVILGGLRYAAAAVPWLVGLSITAAYWFTVVDLVRQSGGDAGARF